MGAGYRPGLGVHMRTPVSAVLPLLLAVAVIPRHVRRRAAGVGAGHTGLARTPQTGWNKPLLVYARRVAARHPRHGDQRRTGPDRHRVGASYADGGRDGVLCGEHEVTLTSGPAPTAGPDPQERQPGGLSGFPSAYPDDGAAAWSELVQPGRAMSHAPTSRDLDDLDFLPKGQASSVSASMVGGGREIRSALADPGYEGAGHGVHTPIKQPTRGHRLHLKNRTYNTLLRSMRRIGERGFALLMR